MKENPFVTGIFNAARLILLIIYALLLTIIIGCIQLVTLAITHIRKKRTPSIQPKNTPTSHRSHST